MNWSRSWVVYSRHPLSVTPQQDKSISHVQYPNRRDWMSVREYARSMAEGTGPDAMLRGMCGWWPVFVKSMSFCVSIVAWTRALQKFAG